MNLKMAQSNGFLSEIAFQYDKRRRETVALPSTALFFIRANTYYTIRDKLMTRAFFRGGCARARAEPLTSRRSECFLRCWAVAHLELADRRITPTSALESTGKNRGVLGKVDGRAVKTR